jgi:tellurite resistance protein TehA-like permease
MVFYNLSKSIDSFFSLKANHNFHEGAFQEYKQDHSKRLLDNFFDVALTGISAAFVLRLLILESKNAILDLILPFVILSFISLLFFINRRTDKVKHYFHGIVVPIVGLLSARKTISQNKEHFYLNESFASWLIMMMFGGFASTMQWYQVAAINLFCFFTFIIIIFHHYGVSGVGNDFYVHITTTVIFSACLIRMNEVNLRSSFNLLSLTKRQEKKWQRVLTLLTDGVLIMQHTESDHGVLLINPSLQKIFSPDKDNVSPN